MTAPAVTVLMPVYNGAAFLREAIGSILGQTATGFELLVVNDGSTDDTSAILRATRDSRLRVIDNGANLGLITSLNRGLDAASGEFVARMDADDIALPRRLERQAAFLRSSPGTGLCGTWFRTIGEGRSTVVRPPAGPEDMAAKLFYESPLAHPTVMFRRALFAEHGLRYSPDFAHAEDYDLWTRAAEVTALANLPEVLLQYRQHAEQVSSAKAAKQDETVQKILLRQLFKVYPQASEAECAAHVAIVRNRLSAEDGLAVGDVESWLRKLIRANDSAAKPFPREAFRRALAFVWWRYCAPRCAARGVLRTFLASELTKALPVRNRLGILALRAKAVAAPS
jgi:glycosyltransferase involved in cell wall biosynthesis